MPHLSAALCITQMLSHIVCFCFSLMYFCFEVQQSQHVFWNLRQLIMHTPIYVSNWRVCLSVSVSAFLSVLVCVHMPCVQYIPSHKCVFQLVCELVSVSGVCLHSLTRCLWVPSVLNLVENQHVCICVYVCGCRVTGLTTFSFTNPCY